MPHETGDIVADGAVAIVGVAGGIASELGVLAIEGLAHCRLVNDGIVGVEGGLVGVYDGVATHSGGVAHSGKQLFFECVALFYAQAPGYCFGDGC